MLYFGCGALSLEKVEAIVFVILRNGRCDESYDYVNLADGRLIISMT
jgi:hypothetical protein